MKDNRSAVIWGVVLVILGGLGILQHFLPFHFRNDPGFWALVFGSASVAFFAIYFISGIRNWGWLFPAMILAALAGIMGLIHQGDDSPVIASLILGAVGLPFIAGYIVEKGKPWGLLIPAWILCTLALLIGLDNVVREDLLGAGILAAIGLPFLVVYFRNRTQWWALIPGIFMTAMGLVSLVNDDGAWAGVVTMLGMGMPFIFIYLLDNNKWWALIPGGFCATITLVILGSELLPAKYYNIGFLHLKMDTLMTGLVFLGMALTFFFLWLKRASQPTRWAIYPAAGLGVVSLMSMIFGMNDDLIMPVLLILCGLIFILVAMRPLKTA